jgi:hypothetical protein
VQVVTVQDGDSFVTLYPSDMLKLTSGLDLSALAPVIGKQWFTWVPFQEREHYRWIVAPARTFFTSLEVLFASHFTGMPLTRLRAVFRRPATGLAVHDQIPSCPLRLRNTQPTLWRTLLWQRSCIGPIARLMYDAACTYSFGNHALCAELTLDISQCSNGMLVLLDDRRCSTCGPRA